MKSSSLLLDIHNHFKVKYNIFMYFILILYCLKMLSYS